MIDNKKIYIHSGKKSTKSLKKIIFLVIFVAFLISLVYYFKTNQKQASIPTNTQNQTLKSEAEEVPSLESEWENQSNTVTEKLVSPIDHALVPFTPQAPTANWDELHNEACEEASLIMASEYFNNNHTKLLDSTFVEEEISKLTNWQDANLGYHLDTTTEETANIAKSVYGLTTEVLEGVNEEQIKNALSEGKLVILSFDGRLLRNPYFKQPGPPHHMILITGFDGNNFITNDPGTKRGREFKYSFETLFTAAGDWSHSIKAVNTEKKLTLLVSKN